jgi:flavin reductase (DIM6/NTAB) family NADH-FMN oxidoreductase RutF
MHRPPKPNQRSSKVEMQKTQFPPSEALYPVPVVLVSSGSGERFNIITIAWCGVVCSSPPLLSISIRPSRYSNKLIRDTGDFVINVPDETLLKKTDLCGIISGRDKDKFKLCNFTKTASSKISSPMIEECPVNIECKLKEVISLGAHDMFIGEVMASHADRSILDKDGHMDYARARPIVYNRGEYWNLGKKIGLYGVCGK